MITTGAEPLFLLDYVAANRIELEQVAELVEGAAEVCRAAGCALIGGETAELPGIYRDERARLRRHLRRHRRRDRLIDGSRVEAGDVVVGLPSAGVHANGFTLVRRVLEDEDYDGDDLLAPTRLYLDDVARAARATPTRSRTSPAAASSATSRASSRTGCAPSSTGTRGSARRSSSWLARHVEEDELRRVFNLGIGFCAVVPDPAPTAS